MHGLHTTDPGTAPRALLGSVLGLRCLPLLGLLALGAGCGRVSQPEPSEVIETGLCDPSQEWHVVDTQIDERAAQSLLWFGEGPILATQWRGDGDNLSSLEHYQDAGELLFREASTSRISCLSEVESGFLSVGHGDGSPRRLAVEARDTSGSFNWSLAFQTEEDVWPQAAYELGGSILVVGTQETYSGADKDVVVFGLSARGELRYTDVYGEDPPILGRSSHERVVASYADAGQVVLIIHKWIDGSGGPLQVLALNAASQTLWEYSDGFEYARGTTWAVARTQDGGALIAGSPSTGGIGHGAARLLRLNRAGNALWVKTLDDGETEDPEVTAAVELPNGGFFLSGFGWGPSRKSWRLEADGTIRAAVSHTDEQLGGAVSFTRARVMPGGGILLASETLSSDPANLNLLRTDSDGQPLWQHQVRGNGVAFVSDLAIGPQGQVVLAGRFAQDPAHDERHVLQLSDSCQLEEAAR